MASILTIFVFYKIMKLRRIYFLFLMLFPALSWADTYPEVVFDNSLVAGSYAKSRVHYSGKSWVENVNNHLLVADTLFFTPGNSLSLKYSSAQDGQWHAMIRYSRQKFLYRVLRSDFLTFRLYVHSSHTNVDDLPRIAINQRNSDTVLVDISKYIKDFEHNKWLTVKIPCSDFNGLNHDGPINGILFAQGKNSAHLHHVFIDQIEFLPATYSTAKLSAAAVFTEAIAFDKMVQLKWQLPLTPSIRYIKIYRSTDGTNYKATSIKPIHMQSALDDVPIVGQKYYYKLTWVDYNYNESPFSEVREVQTMKMESDKLVDMIQNAHINYFIENYDINTGMYMPYRLKEKAVVSTKETGEAILSLIVGAERGLISKQALFTRLTRMVEFLQKADHYHGVLPAYFDGRKGVPEFAFGRKRYDVESTASLIEGLLVARQYFNRDIDEEYSLRTKITALYDRINWTLLTKSDSSNILIRNISKDMSEDFSLSDRMLVGPNYAMNTYMLAAGSSQHALPEQAYRQAVYSRYDSVQVVLPEPELEHSIEEEPVPLADVDSVEFARPQLMDEPAADSVVMMLVPIVDSVWRYGQELLLGDWEGSLMDLYRPFLTIRPEIINDSVFRWQDILKSYVHYVKRRDNELGVGVNDSDIWGFFQFRRNEGDYRINPMVAPSAIIVDPQIGEGALLTLYNRFGKDLFTEYGFRSWLNLRDEDVSDEYIASNQATLAVMIENARTGLIWNLYEQIPELQLVRTKLFERDILQ